MNSNYGNMPTIGVVGVTIPGAIDCINKINQKSREYFDHHVHPNIILHQLNFALTHQAQNLGRWDKVEDRLIESIEALEKARVDFIIIPANTVHKMIDSLLSRSNIPIISMLDVVTTACEKLQIKKIGIMGTRWTMEDHLYLSVLKARNIEEIIPSKEDQKIIQDAIFEELIPRGQTNDKTLSKLLKIVDRLKQQHCDGIALACTELPLVLNKQNCGMPVLDTTAILAEAAVKKQQNYLRIKMNLRYTMQGYKVVKEYITIPQICVLSAISEMYKLVADNISMYFQNGTTLTPIMI